MCGVSCVRELNNRVIKNIKFSNSESSEFAAILRARVNDYFTRHNKAKDGGRPMIVKSIVMLSMFSLPLIIVNTGSVSNVFLLFVLYIISGLGMAGVGMGVMHDAIHGSYSRNTVLNKIMGYTMNLIGANANVWKIQHNVLHHTYTNIDQADDDINAPFFLRFSPHAKRFWLHRFQYIYVWFFYGLSTVSWVTSKDFIRLRRYRKMGLIRNGSEYRHKLYTMIGWKVFYYSYALVLPLIMVPLPAWIILLAFLSMHFITGLCISLVFQTAHIIPEAEFHVPNEQGVISNDWTVHQLITTSNYAPKSRLFSWLIGGLNYQVEHHLFPNISHLHYREISHIVAETADSFGVPYNVKKTFFSAICDHVKMLRRLGTA